MGQKQVKKKSKLFFNLEENRRISGWMENVYRKWKKKKKTADEKQIKEENNKIYKLLFKDKVEKVFIEHRLFEGTLLLCFKECKILLHERYHTEKRPYEAVLSSSRAITRKQRTEQGILWVLFRWFERCLYFL